MLAVVNKAQPLPSKSPWELLLLSIVPLGSEEFFVLNQGSQCCLLGIRLFSVQNWAAVQ